MFKTPSVATAGASGHTYRPEIDGLRTIAVVAVLIYHARFMVGDTFVLKGGYLGVDIFFVISGYLITAILLRGISAGTFTYRDFYNRRLRRLLPALLATITLTFPMAYWLLLPTPFEEFAASSLASLLFVSNMFFLSQDSYVAQPSLLKPLLHTWSLAIEEQFYIVFPVILAATLRWARRWVLPVLVGLTLLSFALSVHQTETDPDSAFFVLPFRFWELGVGAVLAAILVERGRDPGRMASRILPVVGVAALAVSLSLFDINAGHPGLPTLLPVIGTALIIWYSDGSDIVGRVLGTAPFVAIGKISYSLYLVHYPIFALLRVRAGGGELDDSTKIGALGATFFITILIYHLIEKPFRYRLGLRAFVASIAIWALLIVAASVAVLRLDGMASRMEVESDVLSPTFVADVKAQHEARNAAVRSRDCYLTPFGRGFERYEAALPDCNMITEDRGNVVVLGDSTAAGLWLSLTRNYEDANFIQITGSACGHNQLEPAYPAGADGACSRMWRLAYDYVRENADALDGVFITSRFDMMLQMDLEALANLERATGVPMFIFTANRQMQELPHEFLARQPEIPSDPNAFIAEFLPMNDEKSIDDLRAHYDLARSLGIDVIDKAELMCPDSRCTIVDADGTFLWYNQAHWTIEGADEFARRLKREYPDIEALVGVSSPSR